LADLLVDDQKVCGKGKEGRGYLSKLIFENIKRFKKY
jgi:hypothetical protein